MAATAAIIARTATYATSDETGSALAAWARGHGLRYERQGMLPTASEFLEPGESPAASAARVTPVLDRVGVDVPSEYLAQLDSRPHWAESLCHGTLPGGLDGTLAHYCWWQHVSSGGGDGGRWKIQTNTVVVAPVLEGVRVARDLEARAHWPTELSSYEREYGADYRRVQIGPLGWSIPVEEDEQLVRAALERVPAIDATITLRDGWLVALKRDEDVEAADLDHLCRTVAAVADGLRGAARTLRPLQPGDPLPEPRSTPYREWLKQGADRVRWPTPPPDLNSAVTAYAQASGSDPEVRKRRRRSRLMILAVFAVIGAIVAGISAIGGGAASAALMFGVIMLIGLAIAALMGRQAGEQESGFRQDAFGLEAFAREYANSRGLYMEDHDELRRRIPLPVHGSPQRVMRGTLPGGAEGRIVLWRDRNIPERAYVNMAIVQATPAAASPPYKAVAADGGWLVVCEWTDQNGRSAARLDAVAREASRLAAPTSAPR